LSSILFPLALAAYTAGIILSIFGSVRRSRAARSCATASYIAACVLHLGGFLRHGAETGRFAMDNLSQFLLVLGWLVLLLYLVVLFRWKVAAAGLVLPPLAFILTAAGLLLPARDTQEAIMARPGLLLFHIALATLGMAAFFVAATMSLLYVVQDRALKKKRALLWLERLPSLRRADRVGLEAMLWGFPMFSLGIFSGVILNAAEHQTLWSGGPKQIFPVLSWIIFAAVLIARVAIGFRGRKAAYLTITGFLLGLLTIVGISL
jgi:ABC-type uncharacterized transport system permease subunit